MIGLRWGRSHRLNTDRMILPKKKIVPATNRHWVIETISKAMRVISQIIVYACSWYDVVVVVKFINYEDNEKN
jgi:hypothetical protein